MKIVIPMAGTGNRFVQKRYIDPKPLIKVNGKRIIEYVLDMFAEDDEFVFICNDEHLAHTDMESVLLSLRPKATIVAMPKHKFGPVYTVKAAYDHIKDDEEIIISYCDNPHLFDRKDFERNIAEKCLDGCVLTHTGFHPHTLATTKMAFVKGHDGILDEIKEKSCYTDNPMGEHASSGVYYFRRGSDLKKYFDRAMEHGITYNGEYYVTLVYNLLVEDHLRVGYYSTPFITNGPFVTKFGFVTGFGTPEEVENFEAWSKILKGGQVKDVFDLVSCYNYWREYHSRIN